MRTTFASGAGPTRLYPRDPCGDADVPV